MSTLVYQKTAQGRSPSIIGFPAVSESANEQAFALQYTSLILILLTFIVGTFIRPQLPAKSVASEMNQVDVSIGTVEYKSLMKNDEFDESILAALTRLTHDHNVRLEIDVFDNSDTSADSDTRIAKSLAQSVSLQRNLIEQGVLPQTLSVRSHSTYSKNQATVQVFPLREEVSDYVE